MLEIWLGVTGFKICKRLLDVGALNRGEVYWYGFGLRTYNNLIKPSCTGTKKCVSYAHAPADLLRA